MLRRRLFAYTVSVISGIASGYFTFERTRPLSGVMLMICIAACICLTELDSRDDRRERRILILCMLAGFTIFTMRFIAYESPVTASDGQKLPPSDDGLLSTVTCITGRVVSITVKEDGYRLIIAPEGLKGACKIQADCTTNAASYIPGNEDIYESGNSGTNAGNSDNNGIEEYRIDKTAELMIGRKIELNGELRSIRPADDPGCFDYRLYMRSRGVKLSFRADYIRIADNDSDDFSAGTPDDPASNALDEQTVSTSYDSMYYKLPVIPAAVEMYWKYRRFLMHEREAFLGRFEDETVREFMRGMIFGDKSGIDDGILEEFNGNSTGHILAVSGLHIGFLYTLLRLLLGRRHTAGAAVITILVLVMYGEMTMWSASTVRAVLVMSFSLMSVHLRRHADLLTSVSAAALMILVSEPYQLFNTGFQMTFLALTGIAFLTGPLSNFVGNGFAMLLAVQISIAPITAYCFNRFNPLSLLINVPVILIASLLIPYCILLMYVNMITGNVPEIMIHAADLFTDCLIRINRFLSFDGSFSFRSSGLAGGLMSWTDPLRDMIPGAGAGVITGAGAAVLAGFYIVVFLLSSEWMRIRIIRGEYARIRKTALLLLMPMVAFCAASYNRFADDEIVFVSVGQGDCVHIREGSHDILIDGGGSTFYNVGEKTLMPYLLKNGADDIDLACVTHLHTDHYLGISQLAEEYPVRVIGIPEEYRQAIERKIRRMQYDKTDNSYTKSTGSDRTDAGRKKVNDADVPQKEAIETGNIVSKSGGEETSEDPLISLIAKEKLYIEPGSRITISDDVYIEPIWPTGNMHRKASSLDDPNENNMVYMIHYRGVRIMVTGDLLEEDEHAMTDHYRGTDTLKCDILKVAHHGSKSSSSEEFLDAVSPSVAVIQVGRNNLYGHPHPQTLERLENRGIKVYRTDTEGAAGIDIIKNGFRIDAGGIQDRL